MVNKMLKKHYMAFNCLDLHSFLSPRISYTTQCVQTDLKSSFVPRQAETSFNGCTCLGENLRFPIFTARKRSLRRLCFYRCLSVHTGGGACVVLFGGMHGFIWGGAWFYLGGACVVLFGGHVWFYLGGGMVLFGGVVRGFIQGACMVLFGGHVWFYSGGMHGFSGGACMVFSVFFGYNEIRSMSGWYASYWNAFLLHLASHLANALG